MEKLPKYKEGLEMAIKMQAFLVELYGMEKGNVIADDISDLHNGIDFLRLYLAGIVTVLEA